MKNILLIGIGRFGYHIAKELSTLNVELLAIDTNEEKLDDNNKSLGKILFYKKLSEISVSYEEVYMHFGEDKVKKKLKVTIKDLQNKILFKEKNNGGVINHKIKISYLDYNSNTSNTIVISNND